MVFDDLVITVDYILVAYPLFFSFLGDGYTMFVTTTYKSHITSLAIAGSAHKYPRDKPSQMADMNGTIGVG